MPRVQATKAALAATLSEVIQRYERGRPFSAWERHCVAQALKALRFGDYEQARRQIADALTPPRTLPTFPFPPAVRLEELKQALGTIVG